MTEKRSISPIVRFWISSLIPPVIKLGRERILDRLAFGGELATLVAANRELRDQCIGEDLFIVGSGPSIKSQDIGRLRDKNVMWINNLFVHPLFAEASHGAGKKYLIFAPLHRPQADEEWITWLHEMDQACSGKPITILGGLGRDGVSARDLIVRNDFFRQNDLRYYFAGKAPVTEPGARVRMSMDGIVEGAGSCSVYAIMWAKWLGARRIYLLGMDHNYLLHQRESEMRFYASASHQNDEMGRTFGEAFHELEFLRQYRILEQYRRLLIGGGCEIYNCSPESLCRVFPYKKYEEAT